MKPKIIDSGPNYYKYYPYIVRTIKGKNWFGEYAYPNKLIANRIARQIRNKNKGAKVVNYKGMYLLLEQIN